MATSHVRVFVDANVLAKPVTRTLLLAGGPQSGFRAVWSRYVEREADRHLGARMTPVSDLRVRFGWELGPTGDRAGEFQGTDPKDRQVLSDAVAAGAQFVVTADVDFYSRRTRTSRQSRRCDQHTTPQGFRSEGRGVCSAVR